jgi:hypothetical protein
VKIRKKKKEKKRGRTKVNIGYNETDYQLLALF